MEMNDFRKVHYFIQQVKHLHALCCNGNAQQNKLERYLLDQLLEESPDLDKWVKLVESTAYQYRNDDESLGGIDIRELSSLAGGFEKDEQAFAILALEATKATSFSEPKGEMIPDLYSKTESFYQDSVNSVLLFKGTLGNYMAVGKSADLLYEKLGWQTATIEVHEKTYCFMVLCDYSLEAIGKMTEYTVAAEEYDFRCLDLMDDDSVCLSLQQQMIDHFRLLKGKNAVCLSAKGIASQHIDENGIANEIYLFMGVSEEWLVLFSSQAEPREIVKDHKWMTSLNDLRLLRLVADLAYEKLRSVSMPSMIGIDEEIQSINCVDQFVFIKHDEENKILIMDYKGTFETYAAEAILLADKYDLPLWARTSLDITLPAVIIPKELMKKIRKDIPDVVVFKERFKDSADKMAMIPHPLNKRLKEARAFKNVSVSKRKDGKCTVRACLGNKRLPERVIDEEAADYYLRMSDGIIKAAALKTILCSVYYEEMNG